MTTSERRKDRISGLIVSREEGRGRGLTTRNVWRPHKTLQGTKVEEITQGDGQMEGMGENSRRKGRNYTWRCARKQSAERLALREEQRPVAMEAAASAKASLPPQPPPVWSRATQTVGVGQ